MTTITALSGSSLPIQIGTTLNIGVRPGASGTTGTTSSGSSTLTAQQGAAAVSKALTNATAIFTALSSLQSQIQQAGASPDTATAAALAANITTVKSQIDQLASGGKVNSANLLSGTPSSVSVATSSGVQVNIATQALDSSALGLSGISVADATSLRAATAKVARALGQAQLAVYRLQTADGAVGLSPATTSAAATAYDKASGNQVAGTSANAASASVEKALTNQDSAINASSYNSSYNSGSSSYGGYDSSGYGGDTASGYSSTGSATGNATTLQSFLSLFA